MGTPVSKIGISAAVMGCILMATVPTNEALTQQIDSNISTLTNWIVANRTASVLNRNGTVTQQDHADIVDVGNMMSAVLSPDLTLEIHNFSLLKVARQRSLGHWYVGVTGKWIRLPV